MLSSLIRISTGHRIFAPYRGFSQLVTSFFGAMYLGILRKPFVAWSSLFLLVFPSDFENSIILTRLISLIFTVLSLLLKLLLTFSCFINQISFTLLIWKFLFAFRTRLYSLIETLTICYAVVNLLLSKLNRVRFGLASPYLSLTRLWWAQMDSDHRPHAYQACALTSWAMSPFWWR